MNGLTLAEVMSTGRGIERSFCCPVHDDSNASASVNMEKGLWVCYACGASGGIEGYAPSAEDIKRMLDRDTVAARLYPEAWLDAFDGNHASAYWKGRYGNTTARAYRCGTHPWTGNPTYPLRDSAGRVVGVVQRQDSGEPKYLYPAGTSTSKTLGGLEVKSVGRPYILLVEGMSDVMAMFVGRPKDVIVLAAYGSGLHAPQVQMVLNLNPRAVLLGFDSDDAGQAATTRAFSQLAGTTAKPVKWHRYGGPDAGSISTPQKRWEAVTDVLATL